MQNNVSDEKIKTPSRIVYEEEEVEIIVEQPIIKVKEESKFTGGLLELIAVNIGVFLITVLTLGLAYPLAVVIKEKWICKHTYINGRQLVFVGDAFSLFVHYIKWMLLLIITLGIYVFWLQNAIYRWKIENTRFSDSDDKDTKSTFTGGVLDLAITNVVSALMVIFSLGIATPWAITFKHRWRERNTSIEGQQLRFTGSGAGLIGNYIKWFLLSIITVGIYSFWLSIKLKQWVTKNRIMTNENIQNTTALTDISNYFKGHTGALLAGIIIMLGLPAAVTLYFSLGFFIFCSITIAFIVVLALLSRKPLKPNLTIIEVVKWFMILLPTVGLLLIHIKPTNIANINPKLIQIFENIAVLLVGIVVTIFALITAGKDRVVREKSRKNFTVVDKKILRVTGAFSAYSLVIFLSKDVNYIFYYPIHIFLFGLTFVSTLAKSRNYKENIYYLLGIFSIIQAISYMINILRRELTLNVMHNNYYLLTNYLLLFLQLFLGIYLLIAVEIGRDKKKFKAVDIYLVTVIFLGILLIIMPPLGSFLGDLAPGIIFELALLISPISFVVISGILLYVLVVYIPVIILKLVYRKSRPKAEPTFNNILK